MIKLKHSESIHWGMVLQRFLWLNSTMVNCRELDNVENVAVVIAVGVNDEC